MYDMLNSFISGIRVEVIVHTEMVIDGCRGTRIALARGVRGYKCLKVGVGWRAIIDARVSVIIRSARRLIIFLIGGIL
jgi:hypothetical protein